MHPLRQFLRDPIRFTLGKAGYRLVRMNRAPYGFSMLADVARMARYLKWPVEVVFDVGANTGQFAREARNAFSLAAIHSFEPNPRTFQALAASPIGGAFHPVNAAITPQEGEVTLYSYANAQPGASTLDSLIPDARYPVRHGLSPERVTVKGVSLDGYRRSASVSRIDLLKVDTEGFDLAVLESARETLAEGRVRFVYVEYNELFASPTAHGGALLPIAELLRGHGFECVTTYTDYILFDEPRFKVSNALFVANWHANSALAAS